MPQIKELEIESKPLTKVQKEVRELEANLKSYDRVINRKENDNAYYLKAQALVKLAQFKTSTDSLKVQSGNRFIKEIIDNYYDKALECYDKAIKLAPYNQLYLVERSKLYLQLDQVILAKADIVKAQNLQTEQVAIDNNKTSGKDIYDLPFSNEDKVIELYVANTIRELTEEIKSREVVTEILNKDKNKTSPIMEDKLQNKQPKERDAPK